jgi:4-hydroxy-4-methyl-2-oxoglutarate aldolase
MQIESFPDELSSEIIHRLQNVSFPTFGHYLESGFCDPTIQRLCTKYRIVGQAITVRLTAQDSTLLHHTVSQLRKNDVLVIDMGGDFKHAPVGLVVATAAKLRGAAGIVVDGAVTDIDEIADLGIPIYAKGKSILTTKLLGQSEGSLNSPITCGGVSVNAGDIVLGDSNGVAIFTREVVNALLSEIEEDDKAEPDLIAKLQRGALLGDETGASQMIKNLDGSI